MRSAPERDGWFIEPTVMRGALPDEEIFGPVVTVEPFDGEDDAVRRANDTEFGLAASVWSRDRRKADRVARRIEAGMVWVNDFGYSFTIGQAPWGGVKGSGFGRTGSKHGLYECVQIKYVDSDRGRLRPAWWFPYDAPTERALRALLDVLYGDGLERWRAAWQPRRDSCTSLRRSLGDERALARRRGRRGADGRRRREAAVAPPRGRARRGADGAGDGAAAARPAEGRRAHDRAARGDHGGEADERADPALPSAAAVAHRGDARGRRGDASRSSAIAETTAQTGVEMEALTAASVAALTVYDMARRSTRRW